MALPQLKTHGFAIPGTDPALGAEMHALAHRLFPIARSLTGPGVRETLGILGEMLPGLQVHEVPSGTRCLDWTVPAEWRWREAWVEDEAGRRVIDAADHNLHLVGYSEPVDTWVSREELEAHLHSIPEMPEAIPYVTSYYRRAWGFCLPHARREELTGARFRVRIDSELAPGHLTYADLVIPGESAREVLFSTYVCHPSMANNEVSGPVLATFLARWLACRRNRLTYRFVFVPETIGAVVYLSRHLEHLQRRLAAGYVLTCVGDERTVSFMPSRTGGTLADRVAERVLARLAPGYERYSFARHRGSDERQYCSPNADLPVCSIMRSKYGVYPEYHTSLDDLDFVTPGGLAGSFALYRAVIEALEGEGRWRPTLVGEPHLAGREILVAVGGQRQGFQGDVKLMMDILALADGTLDSADLAEALERETGAVEAACRQLQDHGLLERT
jgi:aminopeptidase-like protein